MRKILFILAIICLCILNINVIQAQTQKFYSTDNGLSNSLVNKIFQDSKGFIWIATEYGLNKYDSNKFVVYNHIDGDSTSLKNNYVRTIFEDSNANLYVGTINGLMMYNSDLDNFVEINMYYNNTHVFPHIASLTEFENGDVWIATSGQGVFILPKGQKCATSFSDSLSLTNIIYASVIYKGDEDNVWIGTENNGLNCYNTKTREFFKFNDQSGVSSNHISAIIEDERGDLFVGTLSNGLNRYNKSTKAFDLIPYLGKQQLLVKSLFMSQTGQLLIGTDGQGLKIYDRRNNIIKDYNTESYPFDLKNGKIHSILQDQDNNLWLGLFQKGVVFIPFVEKNFKYWGYKMYNDNPLGSSCVMSLCKDKNNITWVGTDNEGIYGINDEGRRITHFYQGSNPNSVSNIVLSIFDDSDGNLWIGSYTKGLAKMNKQTGQCEYIPELRDKKVYFITQSKDNYLLIGTYDSGFYRMDLRTKALIQYISGDNSEDDLAVDRLCNNWINTMIEDSEGLIWIGHYKGLSSYNPKKNTFLNYFKQNNILPETIVISLKEDQAGKIWIGTTDGLYCFDKSNYSIKKITTNEGLSNNVVCGIEEDEEGNLWISTYHGLNKYIPMDNRFENYYVGDGLQGNEFTRGAFFKDRESKIYFGGTNGVTFFYPSEINEVRKGMNLVLTNFLLGNKAVKLGNKSGQKEIVSTSISEALEFNLSYQDNSFSLEFSSFDYSNSERISYLYRIEGLNDEWMSTPVGVNVITYNNLTHGRYHLQVRVVDNKASSPIKTFTILINPPWYQTWWAYALYFVLFLLAIYAAITYFLSKFRYKQEILKKEHNEAISEAKLQFFINISHEIRTPMTLIINPLEKLIEENTDSMRQKTYLMIYRNAQRILRLINQLMDIRKLDKGQMRIKCRETDIVGFIEDLMLTFEYQANKKDIDLTFLHQDESLKVWIDLNNFDKVLLNILSNAFKYTHDKGSIEIKLETGEDENAAYPLKKYFQITVSDTGIGIDDSHIEDIFKRFYQVETTSVNQYYGTGIGLHLSRLLIELHHGLIYAENRKDREGSRFIIRLPLSNEHLAEKELEIMRSSDNSERRVLVRTDFMTIDDDEKNNRKIIKPKNKQTILIIEDDDEIRNYLHEELSKVYRIKESKNGREGYEIILRDRPDLIISDIMMPEMDGVTLCRKLKQNININHIPIILLTAKTRIEDKLEGLEIGADAYLCKPFNSKELIQNVDSLIANRIRLKAKYSGQQEQSEKVNKIELKSTDEVLLTRIMKVINENISNSKLNVEMLAQNVGMSRVHMHRKLKELTNQSARDFIRGIRLKQAAELLANKKLPISDVAYATGFSNLSHFSNSFREFYGMSPKEYMNMKRIVSDNDLGDQKN